MKILLFCFGALCFLFGIWFPLYLITSPMFAACVVAWIILMVVGIACMVAWEAK